MYTSTHIVLVILVNNISKFSRTIPSIAGLLLISLDHDHSKPHSIKLELLLEIDCDVFVIRIKQWCPSAHR